MGVTIAGLLFWIIPGNIFYNNLLMRLDYGARSKNKEQIIIDGCNVSNCKYYMENNGVEYQGLYQYTNMCYKPPYDNCENKPFCWYKLITRIRENV